MIDNDRYQDIKYGIKLANANIGFNDDIYTFPYFCAFLLKRYLKEKDILIPKSRGKGGTLFLKQAKKTGYRMNNYSADITITTGANTGTAIQIKFIPG